MKQKVIDFEIYYSKIVLLFHYMFLILEDYREQSHQQKRAKLKYPDIVYFLLTLNALVFFGLSTRLLFAGASDLKNLFFAISTTFAATKIVLRLFAAHKKKIKLAEVMKILRKSYSEDEVIQFEISGYIKDFKVMKNVAIFNALCAIFFLNFGPMLKLMLNGELNFPIHSPFRDGNVNGFLYPFAYFWTVFSYTHIIAVTALLDFLLYTLIVMVSIEFKILSYKFRNLQTKATENEIKMETKSLIQRHNELFDITMKLENIFSFPLFCNTISNTLSVCFTAFYATISSGITDISEEVFFCIAILFLIFSQCYFGQMLKDASENVFNGICECGWENMSYNEIKKSFILIIQRSHKSECLTNMKFGDVTLKQFTTASITAKIIP